MLPQCYSFFPRYFSLMSISALIVVVICPLMLLFHLPHVNVTLMLPVVGILTAPKQTKESARSADKRPSPGYCVAICFYYAALGHMFALVGCGRGARPYVSIMRR